MSITKDNNQTRSIDILNKICHQEYELTSTENGYRMLPKSKRFTFSADIRKKSYSTSAHVNLT